MFQHTMNVSKLNTAYKVTKDSSCDSALVRFSETATIRWPCVSPEHNYMNNSIAMRPLTLLSGVALCLRGHHIADIIITFSDKTTK